MPVRKISGEWRGHYTYKHRPDDGDGFALFIIENSGTIEGKAIDDNGPGPARLSGSFAFPSVVFTKVYEKPGTTHEVEKVGDKTIVRIGLYGPPVEYEGSMTEDGKTMSGNWVINGDRGLLGIGSWTAYRVEGEEFEDSLEAGARQKNKRTVDQNA